MYRNYTVCVHVHNLHPGANKYAPTRRQEQNCTRVQICNRVRILKTPFKWPKIHPGCKFAPRVQICTRVQFAHMNECKLETGPRRVYSCPLLINFKWSLYKESIYFYKREDRLLKFVNFISCQGFIHLFVFGAGSS